MNLSLGGVKEEYMIVGKRMTGGLKWEKSCVEAPCTA
jgi:hypothetical protein